MEKANNSQVREPYCSYPLSEWNSWKVGGKADFFCQPENKEEIFYYLQWAEKKNMPVTFLGGGTNVLISDKGVEGLVIGLQKLKSFKQWEEEGCLYINALAGVSKSQIMQIFLKQKLAPALFLCGLPGDVGGGVVMNAGVGKDNISPKEFKDIVDWVKVIRKEEVVCIQNKEIKWEYRSSKGWEPGLIYEVGMSWPMEPIPDIQEHLKSVALKRVQSQPLQSASCGSVFKNPLTGEKSGALIEQSGLKGYQIGQSCISKKHANFIVNKGGAKAMDIHQLIQYIRKTVNEKYNILLEPEVRYLGRWNDN